MAEASTSKPCFEFRRNGKCKYGKRCKYSHGDQTQPPQPTARSRPRTEFENGFREWTFLIPKQNTRLLALDIGKFFRMGWDLTSKEHTETGQQIIKKLATEEGLAMIKTLADEQTSVVSPEMRLRIFTDRTLPFFRTISHPDIQSSLILETPLDTICTFLFGPNGRRAVDLFKSTTSALGALARDKTVEDEELSSIAVTANLAVLEKIVELNQSAQVITDFTLIVNELSTTVPEQLLQAGSRSLTRVRQRLGIGAAMPLSDGQPAEQRSNRPVFELSQDLPGDLSELGPRHDNDHVNISDIKILPTTEEIHSPRLEYLPSSDPTKNHLPGLAGLLDRQFRLLREDTVGQLRDAVQIEFKRLNKPANAQPSGHTHNDGVRNIVYKNVALLRLEFDRNKGLQVVAEFDQPGALAKKGAKEREEWWRNTRQLQIDSFVCLISSTGRAIFFSVCDPAPTPHPKSRNGEEESEDRSNRHSRASDVRPSLSRHAKRATLMLSPAENNSEDITWINTHVGNTHKLRHSLVEFPGVLLPSFQPTLQALQKMSLTLDLPFSQFIAPNNQHAGEVDIPAPAYSSRRGFTFNLETLAGGEPLRLTPGQPFDATPLREKSTLDDAQQLSTINAFRRCLALIQGPPGTGKSFTGVAIIKALLRNRDAAKLGPIICVCYTNHALDQLLEHLVKDGVDQLIRLGSRSKSELLQDLNLHHVSKEARPTKVEGYEKYQLYGELDIVLTEIEELMPSLMDPAHWNNIKDYLAQHHSGHFEQLFGRGFDADGFQEVRGKRFSILHSWIKGAPKRIASNRPIPELLGVDLKEMSGTERLALHRWWVQQSTAEVNRRFLHVLDSYHHIRDSIKRCHQELDLRCLLGAHVIGVTTAGMARNLDVLRRVRAKVVVFEEAGEVLEAHTLTALLPSVEHAILIGDHEQLRPQINKYEFQYDNPRGARFSLDLSLFERLVCPQSGHGKLPYSSLNVQRRMHPSIAELVRSTLYPHLQDHPSVLTHPEVDGMRKRLFWLDHNEKEDTLPSSLAQSFSKTNTWEVEMTAALVSHLVRQGTYRTEDIAVLTPYLGQLQKLKQRLRSSFAIVVGDRDLEDLETKGLEDHNEEETAATESNVRKTTLLNALRIATVDNFQGEEAKVIVISLVRSNEERKCGFLKTSNRINVLLSRARHGMYIIGNTDTARSVPMWNKVITILEKNGNTGDNLALCCPRHKDTPIEVSKPDDFSIFSPEALYVALLSGVATIVNKSAKIARHEVMMVGFWTSVMVTARVNVVDHTPLAAMPVPWFVMKASRVGYAWSRAKYGVAIRGAAKNAPSLAFLASKIVPGPALTEAGANCPARCPSVCGEICPEARYCQTCAEKSVKDIMVDYIMGSTYAEIDLDETPCIVPSCGHILTLESMDGHMEIAKHYTISDDTNTGDSIVALKSSSVPFSASELKNCPICRMPLRNINRYGRIVRRAWIDEATKKFIVWANAQFVPLASKMEQAEAKLREPVTKENLPKVPLFGQAQLSSALDKLSLEPVRLIGSRDQQVKAILNTINVRTRYKDISLLRIDIRKFLEEVDEAEQPISRIHSLVEDARKYRGVNAEITDVPSVLQVRNRLLATVLLLRCDYAILSDFVIHGGETASGKILRDVRLNLALNRKDCESLIQESRSRQQPMQEVEGLLYWARFVALERGRSASLSDADMTTLVNRARDQLDLARTICDTNPGQTAGMPMEVSDAEKMLREATFYAPVTNAEKAAVYAAMAQSFQGTGHWYYCVNGHPFTVGECGMPMQTARCPQCGATVGGTNHQPVAGVTRATDLEAEFRG
ncbi:hypothetical protein IMSHALPRED_003470 [Imshaugia aleurites]|uniref:NFX1-type zinc finger-containing protein 1 n=1 Tax=Imshaugia aleurites TaxID=172621 RepID=A0A8H3J7N5_9LECA|nr:hypothetical protein IMSHALPRED_003470 [Imshaugia aleurites]